MYGSKCYSILFFCLSLSLFKFIYDSLSVPADEKYWKASRSCVPSLGRGQTNFPCFVSVLMYLLPKQTVSSGNKNKSQRNVYNNSDIIILYDIIIVVLNLILWGALKDNHIWAESRINFDSLFPSYRIIKFRVKALRFFVILRQIQCVHKVKSTEFV